MAGELTRRFRELADDLAGAHLLEAALEGAEVIRAEAEVLAPRDSGFLSEHIIKVADKATRDEADILVGASRKAFYGDFQELGTAHQGAQPWLRPAFDATKDRAQQVFADSMRRRIRESVG